MARLMNTGRAIRESPLRAWSGGPMWASAPTVRRKRRIAALLRPKASPMRGGAHEVGGGVQGKCPHPPARGNAAGLHRTSAHPHWVRRADVGIRPYGLRAREGLTIWSALPFWLGTLGIAVARGCVLPLLPHPRLPTVPRCQRAVLGAAYTDIVPVKMAAPCAGFVFFIHSNHLMHNIHHVHTKCNHLFQ